MFGLKPLYRPSQGKYLRIKVADSKIVSMMRCCLRMKNLSDAPSDLRYRGALKYDMGPCCTHDTRI